MPFKPGIDYLAFQSPEEGANAIFKQICANDRKSIRADGTEIVN